MKKIALPILIITLFLLNACTSTEVGIIHVQSTNEADNFDGAKYRFTPDVKEFIFTANIDNITEGSSFTFTLSLEGNIIDSKSTTSTITDIFGDVEATFTKPEAGWKQGEYKMLVSYDKDESINLSLLFIVSENAREMVGKSSAPTISEIKMCKSFTEEYCEIGNDTFNVTDETLFLTCLIYNAKENDIITYTTYYLGDTTAVLERLTSVEYILKDDIIAEREQEESTGVIIGKYNLAPPTNWPKGEYITNIKFNDEYAEKYSYSFSIK